MSEEQFQEKTEQATPKRLDEARKRGQIPRSKELSMAVVLMTGAGMLISGGGGLAAEAKTMMTGALRVDASVLDDPSYIVTALGQAALAALSACTPLLMGLALAAVAGSIAVGGWLFSAEAIGFKFERLDPVKGLGRMFGLNSLVEVAKALAKALLITGAAVGFLWYAAAGVLNLANEPLETATAHSASLALTMLLVCSGVVLVIAGADAPYQLWSWARQLRMTRQEIIDELKESEGRPEVRSRIRALQQEVARRRMLKDVPTADVVITNPTHFAVALRYEDNGGRAPVVVAKGADHVAAQIRSLATENRVALFEAPLLARALYWTTDIGREIPATLYLAVAQVLTYVYRLKAAQTSPAPWPDKPTITVDPALAERPERGLRRRR